MAAAHSSRKIRSDAVLIRPGTKFGALTVIRFGCGGKNVKWLCRCECGTEKLVTGANLRKPGGTRSCGCRHWPKKDPLETMRRKVVVTGSGCWEWKTAKAYRGSLSVGGKKKKAHRAVYELLKGSIPEGMELCHNCPGGDNDKCVNPDHMFVGTHKDNMADMAKKDRSNHGTRCPTAYLTSAQVVSIFKEYYLGGELMGVIAQRHNTAKSTVGGIVRREKRRRETEDAAAEVRRRGINPRCRTRHGVPA
jgi:hypothetical protein